ncbi:MAG: MarR family winged helix-turn-helix transcriptional regulator [Gordonibacter sp.]|uniref:MarR family winged helix-turn-helix transcriptional regulator n=1 Tax=Gordonibacter sp. TaxID=1968902 RepID=UPI002FC9BAD5
MKITRDEEFEHPFMSEHGASFGPLDDMVRELFELMRRARQADLVPAPKGLTQAESRILSAIDALHCRRDHVRPGLVAEVTHTKPSALSQTLRVLEEKGLLERHRTSSDFRGVALSLTDEGKRLAKESKRLHSEHMKEVVAFMGEDDIRHLIRILRKIVEFHEAPRDASAERVDEETDEQKGGESPCA